MSAPALEGLRREWSRVLERCRSLRHRGRWREKRLPSPTRGEADEGRRSPPRDHQGLRAGTRPALNDGGAGTIEGAFDAPAWVLLSLLVRAEVEAGRTAPTGGRCGCGNHSGPRPTRCMIGKAIREKPPIQPAHTQSSILKGLPAFHLLPRSAAAAQPANVHRSSTTGSGARGSEGECTESSTKERYRAPFRSRRLVEGTCGPAPICRGVVVPRGRASIRAARPLQAPTGAIYFRSPDFPHPAC